MRERRRGLWQRRDAGRRAGGWRESAGAAPDFLPGEVVQAATLARALVDADDAVVPSCEAEAAVAILRFGTDRSTLMDFGEFERAVHAPDELALFFQEKQLPALADALRALVGRGSDQQLRVSQLSPEGMQAASSAVCSHIPCQADLIQEQLQRSFAASLEAALFIYGFWH